MGVIINIQIGMKLVGNGTQILMKLETEALTG